MTTLDDALTRNAKRKPRREALIDGDARYTYAELNARVSRAANALLSKGVKKGDRLALMSTNTKEFVITFYAAMRLGLIVAPVNPRMAAPEVTYILDDSGARVFVYDPALAEVAKKGFAASAQHASTLFLGSRAGAGLDDLVTLAAGASDQHPDIALTEQDDAEILYTSGTTGLPKGVLLDQHRVVWDGVNINLACGLRDGDRLLHVAPLYHSAELNLFLNGGMQIGAAHVLLPALDPKVVLEAMEKERVSAFFGVPTMYRFMMNQPDFATRDLSAWRVGMFGAAPMAPADVLRLSKAAPDVILYNLCGPTEAGPGGIAIGGEELRANPSANGWAIVNTEVRVVNTDDEDVAAGETGEIILRGESVMKGY